jgi:hypothetical protein
VSNLKWNRGLKAQVAVANKHGDIATILIYDHKITPPITV